MRVTSYVWKTVVTGLLVLALTASASAGLIINVNPTEALAANSAALDAFNRAAQQWESLFSDPITVTVDADLRDLGSPSILGQSSAVNLQTGFDNFRNRLVADGLADGDSIVSSLPTAAQFQAILPTGFGLDGNIAATKANFKAVGFTGLDTTFGVSDATITFNSGFSFDFDNSDGVGAGLFDFESIAAHEIGHALGFISVVDVVDFRLSNNQTANVAPNPLDLFRFQNDVAGRDPANAADFTNDPRFLLPGGDAIFDSLGPELRLSTGAFNGDGNQASHFKADEITGVLVGILDPTIASGTTVSISDNDVLVFDQIGYDFVAQQTNAVPEPSSLVLLSMGCLCLVGCGWRRKRRETL